MVSKQQKEMKKKKAREADSRKKVLAERVRIRKRAKEIREEQRQEKRIAKLQREMDRLNVELPANMEKLPDNVLSQLEHNAKILGALEQEHEEEKKSRQDLNEGLEEDGHKTLNDKLKFLRESFFEEQREQFIKQKKMEWSKPQRPREVSDVEVIKAPVERWKPMPTRAEVEIVKAPVVSEDVEPVSEENS